MAQPASSSRRRTRASSRPRAPRRVPGSLQTPALPKTQTALRQRSGLFDTHPDVSHLTYPVSDCRLHIQSVIVGYISSQWLSVTYPVSGCRLVVPSARARATPPRRPRAASG